jgi:hypothetical protein
LAGESLWKRCSSCKEPIELGATYWVCSVSTCNRARTALQFCSVSCWDAHLPIARHRESWAEERRAPQTHEPETPAARPKERPRQRIIAKPAPAPASPKPATATPEEILIVASRLKEFVRAESGFNTSDRVLGPLSEIVRRVCREAIANAERDGRKTVLERDVPRS